MSFHQRFINSLLKFMQSVAIAIHYKIHIDPVIHQHYPNSPTIMEMISELNGILINTHPVLDYPRPLPQNVMYIGGFHIGKPEFKNVTKVTKQMYRD